MKNIYLLILKKRWFLFVVLFLFVFITNGIFWNETTQLIRRYPALERLKLEADRESYESLYIPEGDEAGAVVSISVQDRNELYLTLLNALKKGQKIYYNKISYIENGEKLRLLTEVVLEDAFSKEELSEHFLNDLLFRRHSGNKSLFRKIKAVNKSFAIRKMKISYQLDKDYYMNNFYFALIFSCLLLTFTFVVLYWLISASLKICQCELRLLRVLGARKKWLRIRFLFLFGFPIVIAFIGIIFFVYSIGLKFIWVDWLYLLVLNFLLTLLVYINIFQRMKGVFNA